MIEVKSNEKVDARKLHKFLGIKSRFNDWIKSHVKELDLVNGQDFNTLTKNLVNGGKTIM